MHIAFFEPRHTAAVVDAFHELNCHYFGENAGAREAIHRHVVSDILGPESGVRIVVAMDGEVVAGLATISLMYPAPDERGQLYMKDIYVCEAWRGRGVGEQIMRFLARYAVSRQCIRFDWTTEDWNAGAMAFYARLGARPVEEKVYYRLAGQDLADFASETRESTRDAVVEGWTDAREPSI